MFPEHELLENPPTERSQAAVRAPTTRSKATNKPRKQVLSGNTTQGRRLLDLADAYADALGGWSKLTDMQAASAIERRRHLEVDRRFHDRTFLIRHKIRSECAGDPFTTKVVPPHHRNTVGPQ
jgi:hypothetical protein